MPPLCAIENPACVDVLDEFGMLLQPAGGIVAVPHRGLVGVDAQYQMHSMQEVAGNAQTTFSGFTNGAFQPSHSLFPIASARDTSGMHDDSPHVAALHGCHAFSFPDGSIHIRRRYLSIAYARDHAWIISALQHGIHYLAQMHLPCLQLCPQTFVVTTLSYVATSCLQHGMCLLGSLCPLFPTF